MGLKRSRRAATSQPTSRSSPEPAAPEVDGYRDLVVIGHGASATVYRAWQDAFERRVALKVLHVDVSDRRAQRRFMRERALNGRLSHHPNVVTVLDSGFVAGRYPFLAMEHFERGSLASIVADEGPLDVSVALHVGVRIAGALEAAHSMGILHRDVKPPNVLLSSYGEPALADFGISAILELEQSLTGALTPVHAPPEILEGAEPTAQADIYSLGSTIYTLLAGLPPFAGPAGEGMLAQLLRISTSEVPGIARADVPTELTDALRRAMAKQPAQRYDSAADFGRALQAVQGLLGLAVTTLPIEEVTQPTGQSPVRVAAQPAELPPPGLSPRHAQPPAPEIVRPTEPEPVAHEPATIDAPRAAARDALDAPTVAGRQQYPAALEPRRRRRWPFVVGGAAVAAVAVAGALAAIGGDDGETSSSSTTSTTVAAPSTTVALSTWAPTDLAYSLEGGAVLLSWADHTGGRLAHLVYTYPETLGLAAQPVQRGQATHVVAGLDPATPACFLVVALVEPGDEDSPAITADSEPLCINGAVPTG